MEQHNLKLSGRLTTVADYLPKGANFADIGSDHAYLPCYVCSQDKSAVAIAGEVNQGPFESAMNNVTKHGLEKQITVRLGNGLDVIEENDNIKQVVIAGMGGGLITQILNQGKEKISSIDRLILQPNVDARQVRIWLYEHQFTLTDERILEENGHIYEVLVADRKGMNPYRNEIMEKQLFLGPILIKAKSDIFIRKWQDEAEKLKRVLNEMKQAANPNQRKIEQFTKELIWIEEELNDG